MTARTFIAQSAVNLRKFVPETSSDDMAFCVSGHYEVHQCHDPANWQH